MNKKIIFLFVSLYATIIVHAQPAIIDKIYAIVGNNIILKSELQAQIVQLEAQNKNMPVPENIDCEVLDQMMLNKLLLHQAVKDSIEISEGQVEEELDKRIKYFIKQLGSEEKLQEFYKKSIIEIKAEFKDLVRDQLLIQSMHGKITRNITVSPQEVKQYFNKIHADSVPYINSEIEVAHIVKYPRISEEEKMEVKQRLEDYKTRILNGEEFATLAVLYSQDPGTSRKGGDLGFLSRGDLVPEFESVAFNLKPNEISRVVETPFGFHIIQLIERRGDQVNFRHIMLKPNISSENMVTASDSLELIRNMIREGRITFTEAAEKYSDDKETKFSGGVLINQQTGQSRFEPDQVDPVLFLQADKLAVAEISEPFPLQTAEGKQGYRIITVKTRTQPHKANLHDDYQRIQDAALAEKQALAIERWVQKTKRTVYIQVDDSFQKCDHIKDWVN